MNRLAAVYWTSVFVVAACRSGEGPLPAAVGATPAEDVTTDLDVSGEANNILAVAPSGGGLRTTTFAFHPHAEGVSGTLVWTTTAIDGGTCDRDAIEFNSMLRFGSASGTIVRVVALTEKQPEDVPADTRVEWVVQTVVDAACTHGKAALAVKFFPDPPVVNLDVAPLPNGVNASETEDKPTTIPVVRPDRPDAPGSPHLCDPAALPALAHAAIVFHGAPTRAEGCAEQFRWRVEDHLFRDANGCPNAVPSLSPASGQGRETVKIQQNDRETTLNLAWLALTTDPIGVRGALLAGETIHVIPDGDVCPQVDDAATIIRSTTAWNAIIFRGDARSACLTDGSLASSLVDIPPDAVRIRYSYASASTAFWQATVALPSDTASRLAGASPRFRLFNRRIQGFISGWQPMTLIGTTASLHVKDAPTLARILPYQGDLEILLAAGEREACSGLFAAPLFEWVAAAEFHAQFEDLTQPGRTPSTLTEPLF